MEFRVSEAAGQVRVSYDCPCGCTPAAVVDLDSRMPGSEHCCCGRVHFAGPDARGALERYLADRRARGEDGGIVWHFGETAVNSTRDTAVPVAYAIPEGELHRESATAGASIGGPLMNEITLTAEDISCDHCINTIRKAVTGLPQVEFVSGDPETKQVVIRYNPEATSLSAITEAMEEEGYPVRL